MLYPHATPQLFNCFLKGQLPRRELPPTPPNESVTNFQQSIPVEPSLKVQNSAKLSSIRNSKQFYSGTSAFSGYYLLFS